jgi:hypothetical protein
MAALEVDQGKVIQPIQVLGITLEEGGWVEYFGTSSCNDAGFVGIEFEPDADLDGVIDSADSCPNDAESFDGFDDADGCPDHDNDGDGFPDSADDCPGTDYTAGPTGATTA